MAKCQVCRSCLRPIRVAEKGYEKYLFCDFCYRWYKINRFMKIEEVPDPTNSGRPTIYNK